MNEDQEEELEALKAIFEEEYEEISRFPPCFMIRIPSMESVSGPLHIKITFSSSDYPNTVPDIQIPVRTTVLRSSHVAQLLDHLNRIARESLNTAMVYTLVDEATQWINGNVTTESPQEEKEEEVSGTLPEEVTNIELTESKHTGGRWNYVIGLVGKPSAGKSTFFNGCTRLDLAKTGAHPFTTIEPNIGKAFYSIQCPCQCQPALCNAEYSHTYNGERNVPVLLKDVAGLVPGAWEGKGRGNRFMNDLLDADVLMHIVDVSGRTNEKGEETVDYDPYNDVRWLQEELHQWIYQNVHSKWENIVKHPKKLVEMFTGYHANKTTIHSALRSAGVNERELSCISSWKDNVLHKIVDSFLKIRFPMLLVLNKADVEGSSGNITRLLDQFPDTSIAVCSLAECTLQQLHQDGVIDYNRGGSTFDVIKHGQSHIDSKVEFVRNVLNVYKSTNVHKALSMAVGLKSPVYAFPVCDLDSLRSLKRGHIQGHLETDVLRDCIPLKPGTTIEDLHKVMLYDQLKLLKGEFVRAEVLDKDLQRKRPVKKDEVISENNGLIHIMTNKKSSS